MLGGTGLQDVLWIIASLWLVVLTVGAFFAARILSGGVSDPVVELARGMAAVANGDLNTRVDLRARDEMQVLIDSFNTMTDQLKEAREHIVLVEKQAAWRDVARGIAHEIKNPLTPIQIGLHRVRSRLESNGSWEADSGLRESIQTMNEEVEALRRMAASFSEFAQLPQPKMEISDLEGVVRGAVALFQEGAEKTRLKIRVIGQIPFISMDADLVKRALINLVKNAVESVEDSGGGGVDVILERRGKQIHLEVRDGGVGFEPEDSTKLFYPDYSTKSRGTGLGLSIVARIVADHSWHVEAESEGPGKGAVVRVLINMDEEEIAAPLEGLR
jgi:two-component system nitrogen regulation sensor histidine kinase NtrY